MSQTDAQTTASDVVPARVQMEKVACRSSTVNNAIGEDAAASAPGEDGTGERRHEQNTDGENADDDERLQAVHQVVIFSDSGWKCGQVLEDEALENHQKCERDHGHER